MKEFQYLAIFKTESLLSETFCLRSVCVCYTQFIIKKRSYFYEKIFDVKK